jgi:glycolate oxidase FAD binding subunit
MKIGQPQLAQKLRTACGVESVIADTAILAGHRVDGMTPGLVCMPQNSEQVGAAVKICAEAQASLIPWGGGTAMAFGNAPRQADVVMKTNALDRVIEHDHANLTATVQCGITLAALQATLLTKTQFAPFDPPCPERSTLGGIVAANLNGPRRGSYGSVRDLIIGMKIVLGSGETIKAGGKVVKNVAGYDMCKLFAGSLGTLGVITELTLRVAPVAESRATAIASGTLEQSDRASQALAAAKLLPSATMLSRPAAGSGWKVASQFEGFTRTVARQLRDYERIGRQIGMTVHTLDGESDRSEWRVLQDFPAQPERLIYRVTVPRGAVIETIDRIEAMGLGSKNYSMVADLAVGTIWIAAQWHPDMAKDFAQLTALAQTRRGHAVIFRASSDVKSSVDVWGPAPPSFPLMAKLKQQFDPNAILNPGRFIGGL